MQACRICGNTADNKLHTAREMMFGMRETFTYLECRQCGCVQQLQPPANIAKYYPREYYSYAQHGNLKTFFRHHWAAYAFSSPDPVGWVFSRLFFPNAAMRAVRRLRPARQARILDVGCGAGHLLQDLSYLGFQNLTGADPFIERDRAYSGGLTIFKRELDQVEGQFDLLMLHHCFEHMDDPARKTRALARLLAPGGTVLLRIPVASSLPWRRYGVNWVHLDAPRHFYLHTYKSIELLSKQAGLGVAEVFQEADQDTFWCSEAYAHDIAMNDPRFPPLFTFRKLRRWRQNRHYRAEAEALNCRGEADLVAFHLRKT